MPTLEQVVAFLMTPSWPVVVLGLLVVLGAPVLLHLILARSVTYIVPPVVLLLGPSGGGKTALQTVYERGGTAPPPPTRTSQAAQSVELNASTDAAARTTHRNHDESDGTYTKFLLVDTPGHGKLRNTALGKLRRADKLRAVVFVVDAAALGEPEALGPAAQYLYDVLLVLQKRKSAAAAPGKEGSAGVPVLVAANKMDLFTALPAAMVRAALETEITRIRASRSKGLLDSGVGADDLGAEEHDGWLGEYGSEKFTFDQMQEFDIDVDVLPGTVTAEEPDVDKWWWWIAQRI
ncbi:Signal recognition particle receptor, beta subunit [Cordyceps fumosorosea ARSEF 2679]|uniref:Signal recognition particle receptor subunit beta n=1 Tax=Cordyceps fumosorosea (strain ARSEF 2679) TaxID=1081104 RepID=A0A162MBB6_CORFA|nr:Signal recognition particle receptor, beta subunit [Cordyceps fumosorosea ARSEF 2679]OAA53720.1 Signal recognition particle receptor, beta subunit [Cordyceps fumosorosea ARSEF 2679]